MSAPPVLASPPNYSAISALIRRVVALEESGSLKFGDTAVTLTDISNDPALYAGLLTDMSANSIVQLQAGTGLTSVVQSGFITVNFTDEQLAAINPSAGDVMRFINRTLPGDTLSNEWHGIIQLNFGPAGPKFHISPQESLKIAYVGSNWITATGL
jgi:hypothetical protein